MNLKQRLISKYGVDNPFFIKDISFDGLSMKYIRVKLAQLVRDGELARFARGIYYVPTMTPFGESRIPTKLVSNKKYIYKDGKTVGFYSGLTLDNGIGLSTQVPGTVEVTTNMVKENRRVKLGFTTFLLKKPRVDINKKNVFLLQFLDIIDRLKSYRLNSEEFSILVDFIKNKKLRKRELQNVLKEYPKRVAKTLEKTGLFNEFI